MARVSLFVFILILLSFPLLSLSQVKWLSVEEAMEKNKTEQKKFFIDVFTDWCGWCKVMDKETFNHPVISKILNNKFYPIKFNAESTFPITFKQKQYTNEGYGRRPVHEFALYLLGNQPSYPTTVYLDEKANLISPVPGFLPAEKMEVILAFILTDNYKYIAFEDFEKSFQSRIE